MMPHTKKLLNKVRRNERAKERKKTEALLEIIREKWGPEEAEKAARKVGIASETGSAL